MIKAYALSMESLPIYGVSGSLLRPEGNGWEVHTTHMTGNPANGPAALVIVWWRWENEEPDAPKKSFEEELAKALAEGAPPELATALASYRTDPDSWYGCEPFLTNVRKPNA